MSLNTYLTFNDNCRQVFEFYRSVFGGEFDTMSHLRGLYIVLTLPHTEYVPVYCGQQYSQGDGNGGLGSTRWERR